MPRANRYFLPSYIYHITHRCHNKDFHLKFSKDKKVYLKWLFEAKKRFGLSILNYVIMSNHIHLLVHSNSQNVISDSMHLIAGASGQAFNKRKNRQGAYWQDRYFATAIQSNKHFIQCLAYIDLNPVRAGIASLPKEYEYSAYHEIRNAKSKHQYIAHQALVKLSGIGSMESLISEIDKTIHLKLKKNLNQKESFWSDSLAVGDENFLAKFIDHLGTKSKFKDIDKINTGQSIVKEKPQDYGDQSGLSNAFPLDLPFYPTKGHLKP